MGIGGIVGKGNVEVVYWLQPDGEGAERMRGTPVDGGNERMGDPSLQMPCTWPYWHRLPLLFWLHHGAGEGQWGAVERTGCPDVFCISVGLLLPSACQQ